MSFLPEEDQEFLCGNNIQYEELIEVMPDGNERRGVLFPAFSFSSRLRTMEGGSLVTVDTCDLLVLITEGYATTKLDSFYTVPRLKLADGKVPQNADGETVLFGKTWQFWSRHLDDTDWRVGVDSLRTFISYIRGELRNA
jgi:Prokaryotic E2 family E